MPTAARTVAILLIAGVCVFYLYLLSIFGAAVTHLGNSQLYTLLGAAVIGAGIAAAWVFARRATPYFQ
jgi:hypothetical protein